MLDFLKKIFTDKKSDSTTGEVSKADWKNVLLHTGIVAIGAAAAYLANNVGHLDLGAYTVVIVPAVTAGLVALQKWATDNSKE